MNGKVLSFGTHPDDIEIGCGGAEVALIQKGYEVIHAILTSGEAGGRGMKPAALAEQREAEARDAAQCLGVREVEFLRYQDGLTQYTREMKVELIRLIRRVRPDIVFVHTKEDRFPDHRIAHELVMASIEGASGPWYSEVNEEPYSVPSVFGYEVWTPIAQPQAFVGITDVIEIKLKALRMHRSQMKPISYDDAVMGLSRYRGIMGQQGSHAEAFEVIRCKGVLG